MPSTAIHIISAARHVLSITSTSQTPKNLAYDIISWSDGDIVSERMHTRVKVGDACIKIET
jgi:hypothetical protein